MKKLCENWGCKIIASLLFVFSFLILNPPVCNAADDVQESDSFMFSSSEDSEDSYESDVIPEGSKGKEAASSGSRKKADSPELFNSSGPATKNFIDSVALRLSKHFDATHMHDSEEDKNEFELDYLTPTTAISAFREINANAQKMLQLPSYDRKVDFVSYLRYISLRSEVIKYYEELSQQEVADIDSASKTEALDLLVDALVNFYQLSTEFLYTELRGKLQISDDGSIEDGTTKERLQDLSSTIILQKNRIGKILGDSFQLANFEKFPDFVERIDQEYPIDNFINSVNRYIAYTRGEEILETERVASLLGGTVDIHRDVHGFLIVSIKSSEEWICHDRPSLFSKPTTYNEKTSCVAHPTINTLAAKILKELDRNDSVKSEMARIAERGLKIRFVGAHAEGAAMEIVANVMKKKNRDFGDAIQVVNFNSRNGFTTRDAANNWSDSFTKDKNDALRFYYKGNKVQRFYKGSEDDEREHILIPAIKNEGDVVGTYTEYYLERRADRTFIQASVDMSRVLEHLFKLQRIQTLNLLEVEAVNAVVSAKGDSQYKTQGLVDSVLPNLDTLRKNLTSLYLAKGRQATGERAVEIDEVIEALRVLKAQSPARNTVVLSTTEVESYMSNLKAFYHGRGLRHWETDSDAFKRISSKSARSLTKIDFKEARELVKRNYRKIRTILLDGPEVLDEDRTLVKDFFTALIDYTTRKNPTIANIEKEGIRQIAAEAQLVVALGLAHPEQTGQGNSGARFLRGLKMQRIAVFKGQSSDARIKESFGQREALSKSRFADMIHEVGVYHVAEFLKEKIDNVFHGGLENPVPASAIVKFNFEGTSPELDSSEGEFGAIMKFVSGKDVGKSRHNPHYDRFAGNEQMLLSFQLIALMDIILGNVDRHLDNLLAPLDREEQTKVFVYAIDNANILPLRGLVRTANDNFAGWHELKVSKVEFQPAIKKILRDLKAQDFIQIFEEVSSSIRTSDYQIDDQMREYLELRLIALQTFLLDEAYGSSQVAKSSGQLKIEIHKTPGFWKNLNNRTNIKKVLKMKGEDLSESSVFSSAS